MIVQRAASEGSRLVLTLDEHLRVADRIRAAFGNAGFGLPPPADLLAAVVRHHDDGWREEDEAPATDPRTGLPLSLDALTISALLEIARRCVARNLARHPWCGLLVSRHATGLYGDRSEAEARSFLDEQRGFQAELQDRLASDPATRAWVEPEALQRSQRVLSFCDGLSVWLCVRAPDGAGTWHFPALPRRDGGTSDMWVRSDGRVLVMTPWPFTADRVPLTLHGRRAWPDDAGRFRLGEAAQQTVELRP